MTSITVYDPAMCCPTGICGTNMDQKLIDFAANPAIKALMEEAGADGLPVVMVDGEIVSTGRYPARAELAGWAVAGAPEVEITDSVRELIALGAAIAAGCEPCLKYHVKKSRELGLSDAAMREAITVGRMFNEASGKNILGQANKLIPDEGATAKGCAGGKSEAPQAEPQREKSGACC